MLFKNFEAIKKAKENRNYMEELLISDDAKKFIQYVIKSYTKNPALFMQQNKIEWDDLYQACLIGLYNGINKIDLKRNPNEWVRYLYITIQGEIKNFSRSNQSNTLVINQKIRLLYPQYLIFYKNFRDKYDKDPSVKDTMLQFNISRDEAFDLIYGMQHFISYYTESGEINLNIVPRSNENPEKDVINRILIQQYMLLLNENERKVLYFYFYQGLNKTEIARKIGCANSMVHKHFLNAFEKIKQAI